MRTTRSANTKADRSKQTSRARPKARYACFVSLPSGNQGAFPDEEGKKMKSSGISPVFPDETTEFRLPSGKQGAYPDEEGKKLRPSGKTCVFPDETTKKGKPSGNR